MPRLNAYSSSVGSASSAVLRMASLGMNAIVYSGLTGQARPVLLAGERIDVAAYLLGVLGLERLALGLAAVFAERVDERAERDLGVDRDLLATGQLDDHVGATGARVGGDRLLHGVVDAVEQAGGLDQRLELELAVCAAYGVVAQRGRQRLGGHLGLLGALAGGADLGGEVAVLLAALLLEVEDLLLHVLELLGDGGELLQHLALVLLGGGALLGVLAVPIDHLVVLRARAVELLTQAGSPWRAPRRGLARSGRASQPSSCRSSASMVACRASSTAGSLTAASGA